MAIRLGSVVINCADIELMTQFWTAALDLQAGPLSPEGDFRVLGGSVTAISLQVAKTPTTTSWCSEIRRAISSAFARYLTTRPAKSPRSSKNERRASRTGLPRLEPVSRPKPV